MSIGPGACRDCPRLAEWLDASRVAHPAWHNAPVPSFGDPDARLLVVGLAPGLGGANRHGRPFTGDESGAWLWAALHRHGFASQPASRGGDDLRLTGALVTNAVKCAPPGNRPLASEIANCRRHLAAETEALANVRVVVALGRVAHEAWLALLRERDPEVRPRDYPFAHGALHEIPGVPPLLDTFHPSPLNTRTGRLSRRAWNALWRRAAKLAARPRRSGPPWSVYIARCGDGTFYTGVTNDLERRRRQHEEGKGAKYTRGRGPIEIVWSEGAATKGAALVREHALKRLTRTQKERLVRSAARG